MRPDTVDRLDWAALAADLGAYGHAQTPQLLTAQECASISALYEDVERFRSTIDMARYRFGSGQYRYFDHPLPHVVAGLREAFYPHLLPIAREWAERLRPPRAPPATPPQWVGRGAGAGRGRAPARRPRLRGG